MSEMAASGANDDKKEDRTGRAREGSSNLANRQDEETEACVDVLEEGLLSYIGSIVQELSKVNKMVNDSKFINPRHKITGAGFGHSGINSELGTENHVLALSVVLNDPWSSYKTAEKEDLEEQKRNEDKIQQKDATKPENGRQDGTTNPGKSLITQLTKEKPLLTRLRVKKTRSRTQILKISQIKRKRKQYLTIMQKSTEFC
jgi:hypothetical protein